MTLQPIGLAGKDIKDQPAIVGIPLPVGAHRVISGFYLLPLDLYVNIFPQTRFVGQKAKFIEFMGKLNIVNPYHRRPLSAMVGATMTLLGPTRSAICF